MSNNIYESDIRGVSIEDPQYPLNEDSDIDSKSGNSECEELLRTSKVPEIITISKSPDENIPEKISEPKIPVDQKIYNNADQIHIEFDTSNCDNSSRRSPIDAQETRAAKKKTTLVNDESHDYDTQNSPEKASSFSLGPDQTHKSPPAEEKIAGEEVLAERRIPRIPSSGTSNASTTASTKRLLDDKMKDDKSDDSGDCNKYPKRWQGTDQTIDETSLRSENSRTVRAKPYPGIFCEEAQSQQCIQHKPMAATKAVATPLSDASLIVALERCYDEFDFGATLVQVNAAENDLDDMKALEKIFSNHARRMKNLAREVFVNSNSNSSSNNNNNHNHNHNQNQNHNNKKYLKSYHLLHHRFMKRLIQENTIRIRLERMLRESDCVRRLLLRKKRKNKKKKQSLVHTYSSCPLPSPKEDPFAPIPFDDPDNKKIATKPRVLSRDQSEAMSGKHRCISGCDDGDDRASCNDETIKVENTSGTNEERRKDSGSPSSRAKSLGLTEDIQEYLLALTLEEYGKALKNLGVIQESLKRGEHNKTRKSAVQTDCNLQPSYIDGGQEARSPFKIERHRSIDFSEKADLEAQETPLILSESTKETVSKSRCLSLHRKNGTERSSLCGDVEEGLPEENGSNSMEAMISTIVEKRAKENRAQSIHCFYRMTKFLFLLSAIFALGMFLGFVSQKFYETKPIE